MPLATKESRLTINGTRVLEIIDVTSTQPVEEEDTSTIDRAEDNYSTRTSIDKGTAELTINYYADDTDLGQAEIVLAVEGLDIVWYPTGDAAGKERYTYSNCLVSKADPNTVAYKGKFKKTATFKANGGLVIDRVPA